MAEKKCNLTAGFCMLPACILLIVDMSLIWDCNYPITCLAMSAEQNSAFNSHFSAFQLNKETFSPAWPVQILGRSLLASSAPLLGSLGLCMKWRAIWSSVPLALLPGCCGSTEEFTQGFSSWFLFNHKFLLGVPLLDLNTLGTAFLTVQHTVYMHSPELPCTQTGRAGTRQRENFFVIRK